MCRKEETCKTTVKKKQKLLEFFHWLSLKPLVEQPASQAYVCLNMWKEWIIETL